MHGGNCVWIQLAQHTHTQSLTFSLEAEKAATAAAATLLAQPWTQKRGRPLSAFTSPPQPFFSRLLTHETARDETEQINSGMPIQYLFCTHSV